ncbi:uncharacterized protein LY89DRAFT_727460 [Mollisia scopiformis]|uniref:2EXR domain-containing protein n=1 Tax=Mollisia scopiformis TaxID=149040 RepID=A0A194XWN7_MOLSC|nr:uncharacterized protein LY89DRAFT_727460 [Mollisia scopiformis]KUJ24434.1 hypothetical protein LY89DRAFT_727460 [Mollisia scopiformis]
MKERNTTKSLNAKSVQSEEALANLNTTMEKSTTLESSHLSSVSTTPTPSGAKTVNKNFSLEGDNLPRLAVSCPTSVNKPSNSQETSSAKQTLSQEVTSDTETTMDNGTPLLEFTLFPELPPELRLRIFHFAAIPEPRDVQLTLAKKTVDGKV